MWIYEVIKTSIYRTLDCLQNLVLSQNMTLEMEKAGMN